MGQLLADVGAPQTETEDGFAVFGAALSSSLEPVKRINTSISHPTTPASHPNSKKCRKSNRSKTAFFKMFSVLLTRGATGA